VLRRNAPEAMLLLRCLRTETQGIDINTSMCLLLAWERDFLQRLLGSSSARYKDNPPLVPLRSGATEGKTKEQEACESCHGTAPCTRQLSGWVCSQRYKISYACKNVGINL